MSDQEIVIPEPEEVTPEQLQEELTTGSNLRGIGLEQEGDIERMQEQLEHGVINPILLARYIGVRPQMIYQAIRDGKLTAVDFNNTQKKFIRLAEAISYASRYLNRKQQRDLEKLREEAILKQQRAS
jgi:hypothetical protein